MENILDRLIIWALGHTRRGQGLCAGKLKPNLPSSSLIFPVPSLDTVELRYKFMHYHICFGAETLEGFPPTGDTASGISS